MSKWLEDQLVPAATFVLLMLVAAWAWWTALDAMRDGAMPPVEPVIVEKVVTETVEVPVTVYKTRVVTVEQEYACISDAEAWAYAERER